MFGMTYTKNLKIICFISVKIKLHVRVGYQKQILSTDQQLGMHDTNQSVKGELKAMGLVRENRTDMGRRSSCIVSDRC